MDDDASVGLEVALLTLGIVSLGESAFREKGHHVIDVPSALGSIVETIDLRASYQLHETRLEALRSARRLRSPCCPSGS